MKYITAQRLLSLSFLLALGGTILFTGSLPVMAAGDHLDRTFDGNGKLATDFDSLDDRGYDVAVQPDGKIVVVGNSGTGSYAVARYNPNGSLDTTFSGDGKVTLPLLIFGSPGNIPAGMGAKSVVIQSDGKIIVAGHGLSSGIGYVLYIVRCNPNGSVDTDFGNNGVIVISSITLVGGIALQTDGKLVVVGSSGSAFTEEYRDWAIFRFTTGGDEDTSFSGDGRVATDFGGNDNEFGKAVSILPNGKILVAGTANPGGQDFALALYATNGTLDTSFDGDGKVATDLNGGTDTVNSMRVQPDGKIVVAGSTVSGGSSNFALVRYNSNGTLDTSFDGDGKVETNIAPGGNDSAKDVAFQSDGKIVAVGDNGNVDFALARYNANGSLDAGFGQSGLLLSDMSNSSADTANAITVQTDGKLVVAGNCKNTAAGSTINFCVARYLPGSGKTFDYDGDARSDISVFRPANGAWYLNQSTAGPSGMQFGNSTDRAAPADYDGDGKTDIAVYRPSEGRWYIVNSSNGTVIYYIFGLAEDLPAPADYDGDGKADICIFRPSIGTWYRQNSSNGSFSGIQFGANGDRPTVGDFDGDLKADIGIWRPSNGDWYHIRSSNGTIFGERFGVSTDKMVPADYDGDGRMDIAIWRPSTGIWYIKQSSDNSYVSFVFGLPADVPAPADYDGDGKADRAVFRPSDGTWYITNSTNGSFTIFPWGQNGDRPTPNAFLF